MKRENQELLLITVIGVLTTAVCFLVEHELATMPVFTGRGLISTVIHELGTAVLIGALLNLSMEHFNRRRHQDTIDQVKESVLTAALKRSLPEAVFREVDDSILKCGTYRKNHRICYTLERLQPALGRPVNTVLLSARASYELVNTSHVAQAVPIKVAIDRNADHVADSGIDYFAIDGTKIEDALLADMVEEDLVNRCFVLTHSVRLDSGKSCRVELHYRQAQSKHNFETLCELIPTTELYVEVFVPRDNFEVRAMSLHPRDPVQDIMHDGVHRFAWHMPCAVLPGQGLLLMW
jgi:hypothetical protein